MSIGVAILGVLVQIFVQNQQAFRDQNLVLELQQSLRAVAGMLADDIRRAGTGVPVFAARYEAIPSVGAGVLLEGTDSARLAVRTAPRRAENRTAAGLPIFQTGFSLLVRPDLPQPMPEVGDHVFLWGRSETTWTWVRARVDGVDPTGLLDLLPLQISTEGGRLTGTARLSIEDGVSWRLDGDSIRRGELRDLSDLANPLFRESSLGEGFTALVFRYYDRHGASVDPSSIGGRASVGRIDFLLEAETRLPLADGGRPRHTVTMSISPRNLEID